MRTGYSATLQVWGERRSLHAAPCRVPNSCQIHRNMLKYPQFCERFLYTGCAVHKLGVRGRTLVKPFVKCILYLFYAIKSHKSASYMGADAALRFLRLVLWDHLQHVGECGACLALFGYLQIVRIVLHFRNGHDEIVAVRPCHVVAPEYQQDEHRKNDEVIPADTI